MKKWKVLGCLAAACIAALAFLFISPVAFADTDTNAIDSNTNPNLYDAILADKGASVDANGDGILQASELHTISGQLNLSDKNITDAGGLQYCDQVTSLNIYDNNLTANLSDIAAMPALTSLDISDTGITDVSSVFSSPSALTSLNLARNSLSLNDLKKLTDNAANFPDLTTLVLDNNTGLGNDGADAVDKAFPGLTDLEMTYCGLTDISGLADMTHLQSLYIARNTSLSDISVVQHMPDLQTLVAWDDSITSISCITNSNLPELRDLDLRNSKGVTDISALAGMNSSLRTLDLSGTGVSGTGFQPLQSLTNLTSLRLDAMAVTDADLQAYVSNLTNLWEITLEDDDANITSLSPLTGLTNLNHIDLIGDRHITDLPLLQDFPNLHELVYPESGLTNLSFLANVSHLTYLWIGDNYISDLSPIAGFHNCELIIDHNALNLSDPATTAAISTLEANSCTVSDTPQKQFTVNYSIDAAKGTASKAQDTGLAYGQSVTMPTVTAANPSQYAFSHWNKAGSGSAGSGATTALTVSSFNDNNYDGNSGIYTVTYTAVFSAPGAYLSDPGISGGTLSTAFAKTKYSYKVSMTEAQDKIIFAPVPEISGASVWVSGTLITPSNPSKSFNIDYNQTKTVSVKVKYGKSTHTYTFTVHRAKSTYNLLTTLTAYANGATVPFNVQNDPGTTITFDPNANHYYLNVGENTAKVTIKAAGDSSQHETVSPKSATYSLQYGQTKTVKVSARSQSGKTNPYTVTITRAKCSDAYLSSLKTSSSQYKITPAFNKNTLSGYAVYLPYNVGSVTLSAKAEGYKASVVFTNVATGAVSKKGSMKVSAGIGSPVEVKVTVTAHDGTVKEYTVTVYCGAQITSFTASPMSNSYAVLKPNGTDVITFTWTQTGYARTGMQINGNIFWDNYAAGTHTCEWNGSSEGNVLPPGYYVAHLYTVCGGKTSDEATVDIEILP